MACDWASLRGEVPIVEFHKSLFHGELVKRLTACTLFILFGLVLFVPAVADADRNSAQRTAQQNSKIYMKQQKKAQKKAQESQKKAQKNLKKQHPTAP
jgi:hypothetical protein